MTTQDRKFVRGCKGEASTYPPPLGCSFGARFLGASARSTVGSCDLQVLQSLLPLGRSFLAVGWYSDHMAAAEGAGGQERALK